VKGASQAWAGPERASAEMPGLPDGAGDSAPPFIELSLHDDSLKPMAGTPYRVVFTDGTQLEGVLDANGYARHDGVPNLPAQIYFGDSQTPPALADIRALTVTDAKLNADLRSLGLDPDAMDLQSLMEHACGRSA